MRGDRRWLYIKGTSVLTKDRRRENLKSFYKSIEKKTWIKGQKNEQAIPRRGNTYGRVITGRYSSSLGIRNMQITTIQSFQQIFVQQPQGIALGKARHCLGQEAKIPTQVEVIF